MKSFLVVCIAAGLVASAHCVILGTVGEAIKSVGDIVGDVLGIGTDLLDLGCELLKTILGALFKVLADLTGGLGKALLDVLKALNIVDMIKGLVDGLTSALGEILEGVNPIVADLVKAIVELIGLLFTSVGGIVDVLIGALS